MGKSQRCDARNPKRTILVWYGAIQAMVWANSSSHCCRSADGPTNECSWPIRENRLCTRFHCRWGPVRSISPLCSIQSVPRRRCSWLLSIKSLWQDHKTLNFLRMTAPVNLASPWMWEQRIPSCVSCLFSAFANDTIASWSLRLYLCLGTDCALDISLQGCFVRLSWPPTGDRPKEPGRTQGLDELL